MERKTAHDFDQDLLILFDAYVHGDIARRLAVDNFVAFAPDALFPLGGYPGDEDKAREVFPKLDQAKTREDFIAAAAFLKGRPEVTGKIGAVGFCYGGGMVNYLASRP